MAAINFPISPNAGQSYTQNGATWYYDGVKWVSGGTFGQSALTPMYQQGYWKPTVNTTDNVDTWLTNGVSGGLGMSNWTASWNRTGNQVTLEFYLTITNAGTSAAALQMTSIPYSRAVPNPLPGGGKDGPGTDTGGYWNVNANGVLFSGLFLGSFTGLIAYMYNNWDNTNNNTTAAEGGITFQAVGQPNVAVTGTTAISGSNVDNGAYLSGNITYTTDDTTWTPINGATVS